MFVGDRRDQKTLERLRAERQAKIDELKERTNYYTTQQLIQVIIVAGHIIFAPMNFILVVLLNPLSRPWVCRIF